jgi:hypothetical protein
MIRWTHRLEIQVQLALDEENWPDILPTRWPRKNTLPAATQELVEIRAGQINGCGFSTDMHTKDSRTPAGPRRGSTWSRPRVVSHGSSSAPSDRSQTVPADHVQEDYADFWVSCFCLTWEDAPW